MRKQNVVLIHKIKDIQMRVIPNEGFCSQAYPQIVDKSENG
jgi:hypothetical protein